MNPFYLRLLLERGHSLTMDNSNKVNYEYTDAVLLAKATELKSKKRRKVVKRFKKALMVMLEDLIKKNEDKHALD